MQNITLNISSIDRLDADARQGYYQSPFGFWSPTQVWTWAGGGFAILGITPTRGHMESYAFWRRATGEVTKSRVFSGAAGIGPLLKSYGFESVVADPNPSYAYGDSSPSEVGQTGTAVA